MEIKDIDMIEGNREYINLILDMIRYCEDRLIHFEPNHISQSTHNRYVEEQKSLMLSGLYQEYNYLLMQGRYYAQRKKVNGEE